MPGEELCVHDVGQYGFFAARKSGLHSRTFGRDNANDHSHGDAVSKSLPWHYRHQVRVVQLIISDYFAFCLIILSFFSLSLYPQHSFIARQRNPSTTPQDRMVKRDSTGLNF